MLVRILVGVFGTAAFFAGSLLFGAFVSWMELSSEAYAFSDAQFAELRQEHVSAMWLWGTIAVFGALSAIVLVRAARRAAQREPRRF